MPSESKQYEPKEPIVKLYEPKETPMQVAACMSGSGSNVRELMRTQKELESKGGTPYNISVIVTDNCDEGNNTWNITEEFQIPNNVIYSDFKEFKSHFIKNPKDFSEREPYFEGVLQELKSISPEIDFLAFGGYEIIVTNPLLSAYENRIINVHPADLSIIDEETERRKYIGNRAVLDAIIDGQTEIRASTHLVTHEVDGGAVLGISAPVTVDLEGNSLNDLKEDPELAKIIAKNNQSRLKEVGDWRIFPPTLVEVALGMVVKDADGRLFIKNEDGSFWALPLRCE